VNGDSIANQVTHWRDGVANVFKTMNYAIEYQLGAPPFALFLQGCIVAQYRLFLKKIGALHDIYFKVNPKYGMKPKSQQNTSSKHLVFTKIVPFSERWRINK